MLAEELRKFPAETVLYLGALPELSVSFLREQGFRTAWKDDPREVNFLYANSYEREAAAQLFEKWLETHPMPQALFTTSFALLQGVMGRNAAARWKTAFGFSDCDLRRS
ncbi:fructose repressor [Salmonella enterica subsp. enterica]|nr:fructose repressor [Salmonella enterica subsp. enterica]